MKRSTKYKFGSLILLGGVLISFNQCMSTPKNNLKFSDKSGTSTSSSGVTVSKAVSLDAFSKTAYTVTRAHCASCHGTFQTPLHASSDVNTAYDAVINSSKVDLNNPSNSRLVLKLRNEKHNCWGVCSDNATEMENQIISWKNLIGSTTPTTANNGKTTKESLTIQQALNPDNSYSDGTLNLMTESASIKAPMILGNDAGVSYVWVPTPNVNKDLTSSDAGVGMLNFTVPMADFYKIYMLVNAPTTTQNVVYIKAAGSDYKEWTIDVTKGFEWREVANTPSKLDTEFYMTTGKSYTLEMRQKFAGLKIAKVTLTNDLSYDPTATPKALLKATLSIPIADLTGIADALFEIDIEDFDMYSYKVSNPRIKSSKNIAVKTLKVLVNGVFNPQHATYEVVDKTVTSQDGILSAASMILLKDKGAEFDKLSFAFGTIQAAK